MKTKIKKAERIRRLEEELTFASPSMAARLTKELVRLKAHFYD